MLGVHSLSVYVDVHLVVLTFFVLFSFPSSLPSPLSFSLRWLCTSLRSLVVLSIVPRFFVLLRPPFRRQQMIFVRMTLWGVSKGGVWSPQEIHHLIIVISNITTTITTTATTTNTTVRHRHRARFVDIFIFGRFY